MRLEKADFWEFFGELSGGQFFTKWKKHGFITTAAPPTGNLWKIKSPTFEEDIFLSHLAQFEEN